MKISKPGLSVLFLLLTTTYVIHMWSARNADFLRLIYPVEARVSSKFSCSSNSPEWMELLLSYSLNERFSLRNQIAYVDQSGQLFHCENGWSGSLLNSPLVSLQNRYRYASVTKLITADAVLQLIESGKLSLDTKLLSFFPEVESLKDTRVAEITIAHLLNHTSGFNRLTPSGDPMFNYSGRPWCPYEISQLSKIKLASMPGEKQIYSNLGYCLLGVVVEKINGIAYRNYVEELYGLNKFNIKFINGPYLKDEVKYDFRNDDQHTDQYYKKYDFMALSSSAGLSGSAVSLGQLLKVVLSRPGLSLLDASSFKGCNAKIPGKCYGYAFFHFQKEESLKLFIHEGYLPGSASTVIVDNYGGILVLLNAGRPQDLYRVNQKTYELIYGFLQKQYGL
jgi:D-alanyl-D-alanine carboxypeptidase